MKINTVPEPFRARHLPHSEQQLIHRLLTEQRWAAAATVNQSGHPECSFLSFALRRERATVIVHISQLSPHTQNLSQDQRISLGVTAPETPDRDPQTLPRISLIGTAQFIDKQSSDYAILGAIYREKLPDSTPLFDFGDFRLVEITVEQVRFVGGFARAYTLDSAGFIAVLHG